MYFNYLEQAFLIKKFNNFSKNIISVEKRLKKYYLASPSFSYSLVDFPQTERLFENYFASILKTNYFWLGQYKNEVDFILKENEEIVPVEIKYKKAIDQSDIRNLKLFMNKYSVKKAHLYYLGEKNTIKLNDKEIILFPFYSL